MGRRPRDDRDAAQYLASKLAGLATQLTPLKHPTPGGEDFTYYRVNIPKVFTFGSTTRGHYWLEPIISLEYAVFEVIEVHGSCNFVPDIPPESMRGATYQGVQVAVEAPVRPIFPPDDVLDYLSKSDASLAPVISMYAEGKQVLFSAGYVREHQARLQGAVAEADKIFLVGIRVWPADTHIWDHVAASDAWLGYVGFEPDEFYSWCEAKNRRNHHFLARTFEDALSLIEREIDVVTK